MEHEKLSITGGASWLTQRRALLLGACAAALLPLAYMSLWWNRFTGLSRNNVSYLASAFFLLCVGAAAWALRRLQARGLL